MGVPSRTIVPEVGFSRPATALSVVLLPAPLAPRTRVTLPGLTVRLTPRTASTLP